MEATKNKLIIEIREILANILSRCTLEVIASINAEAENKTILEAEDIKDIYEKTTEQIEKNSLKDIYFSLSNLMRFVGGKSLEEQLNMGSAKIPLRKYFYLFDDLNYVFKTSTISVREKLNMLLDFIKNNIEKGILECQTDNELLRLGDRNFFKTEEELDLFLEAYQKLKEKNATKTLVDSALLIIDDCKKHAQTIIEAHRIIDKHYLKNNENRKDEDIEKVIEAFENLEIDKTLCSTIKIVLVEDLEKERKKKIKNGVSIKNSIKIETPKPLSKTEYDAIYSRIMKMYDIEEHTIVSALTKEEIVYLVSLMFRINIPEKEIRKSIQKINWQGWKAYDNPIKEFNDYYDKLQKNSHIGEVEIALQNIKEYLSLAFLPENDNEYVGWKQEIAEELKRVRKILNQDDTYELEEGRKLYRNRINAEKKKED